MDPQTWGPSGWLVLHRMAYTFDKACDAKEFYRSLGDILPCGKCRRNFQEHMMALPFPTHRRDVPRWVYDIHHRVNGTKGTEPTSQEPSWQEVEGLYRRHGRAAHPDEWAFLVAVAKTHPGKRKAMASSYAGHLQTFLSYWTKHSDGIAMPSQDVIASKTLMKGWVSKHKKDSKATTTGLRQCSTNSCMLP